MTSKQNTPQQPHRPVLAQQVVDILAPRPGETYLDLTAGFGGHARAIIGRIGAPRLATLIDRDPEAIASLESFRAEGARIIRSDFAAAAESLVKAGEQFNLILIDLGVSSPQFDNPKRGFSIQYDGPLDMRMDQGQATTAADIVNRYPKDKLAEIIRDYGEEPKARAIAEAIIRERPITSTSALAKIVAHASRAPWTTIHPATRTFQALRIALNDELAQIQRTLLLLSKLLKPDGRVAIISFHSLEDRLVKQFFKEESTGFDATFQTLTKKPISGATDDVNNPRARSAKLRGAVKIKTK